MLNTKTGLIRGTIEKICNSTWGTNNFIYKVGLYATICGGSSVSGRHVDDRNFRQFWGYFFGNVRVNTLHNYGDKPVFLTPAVRDVCLAVNTRAGHRPDECDRPELKCLRAPHRQTWICQLEVDVGLAADTAWVMASDCDIWTALRTASRR